MRLISRRILVVSLLCPHLCQPQSTPTPCSSDDSCCPTHLECGNDVGDSSCENRLGVLELLIHKDGNEQSRRQAGVCEEGGGVEKFRRCNINLRSSVRNAADNANYRCRQDALWDGVFANVSKDTAVCGKRVGLLVHEICGSLWNLDQNCDLNFTTTSCGGDDSDCAQCAFPPSFSTRQGASEDCVSCKDNATKSIPEGQCYGACSTRIPTAAPTTSPTAPPSQSPSPEPTTSPSESPSPEPTTSPSKSPSTQPTTSPSTVPSTEPTSSPSELPSTEPTTSPSTLPSAEPTSSPSASPTASPSESPSHAPTYSLSASPSASPSRSRTMMPSDSPTRVPSASSSALPTVARSESPTRVPSNSPSMSPSVSATVLPTTSVPSIKLSSESDAALRGDEAQPSTTAKDGKSAHRSKDDFSSALGLGLLVSLVVLVIIGGAVIRRRRRRHIARSHDNLSADGFSGIKEHVFMDSLARNDAETLAKMGGQLQPANNPEPPPSRKTIPSTMDELLGSRYYRAEFMVFLEERLAPESLMFWEAVERYEKLSDNETLRHRLGEWVMKEFILVGSPNEINLSASLRQSMVRTVEEKHGQECFDSESFSAAKHEIYDLLRKNFLKDFQGKLRRDLRKSLQLKLGSMRSDSHEMLENPLFSTAPQTRTTRFSSVTSATRF